MFANDGMMYGYSGGHWEFDHAGPTWTHSRTRERVVFRGIATNNGRDIDCQRSDTVRPNKEYTLRLDYEAGSFTYPLLVDTGIIQYLNPCPSFGLVLNWETAPGAEISSVVWRVDHNRSAALWRLLQSPAQSVPTYDVWCRIDHALVEAAMSRFTTLTDVGVRLRSANEVATIGGWSNGKWNPGVFRRIGQMEALEKTSHFSPRSRPFVEARAGRYPSIWRLANGETPILGDPSEAAKDAMINDADGATLTFEGSEHRPSEFGAEAKIALAYRLGDKKHVFNFRLPHLSSATHHEPGKVVPPSIDLSKLTYHDRIKLSTSQQERMRVHQLSRPHWETGKSQQCYYINRFLPFGAHWEVANFASGQDSGFSDALIDCCTNALPLWPRWAVETGKLMAKRFETARDPSKLPHYPVDRGQRELCLTTDLLKFDEDGYYGHVLLKGIDINSFMTGVQMVVLDPTRLGPSAKFGWEELFS